MKIMIINPDYGMTREEMDLRCHILSEYVGSDTELYMECLTETKVYVDSAFDVVMAGPEIVKRAMKAEEDGFDAVVLYCFSDPALDACREALSIPVVGGGQASCLTSMMVGRQSGILITDKRRMSEKMAFRYQTGLMPENIKAIESVDLCDIDVWKEREKTVDALIDASQKLMQKEEVQVIILGCLSFLGLAKPLTKVLQIPVIDSAIAAVSMAESLVRQKLFTSKIAYATPPAGKRSWQEGSITIG
ncbi:MAG: aspartate/glutamate racemase family protein [Lachnospiraceae bacterium]|nr:aspartate/glutamate racemase family protein [Lachnospiraceae bacterium]